MCGIWPEDSGTQKEEGHPSGAGGVAKESISSHAGAWCPSTPGKDSFPASCGSMSYKDLLSMFLPTIYIFPCTAGFSCLHTRLSSAVSLHSHTFDDFRLLMGSVAALFVTSYTQPVAKHQTARSIMFGTVKQDLVSICRR